MTAPSAAERDDPTGASMRRVAELLHELTADSPQVRQMIERCIHALVMDNRRRALLARLERLPPEDLAAVAALVEQLELNRREDVVDG